MDCRYKEPKQKNPCSVAIIYLFRVRTLQNKLNRDRQSALQTELALQLFHMVEMFLP
jgi:hypothetical protein